MPTRILPSRNAKTAAVANVTAVLEAESQPEHELEIDDVVQDQDKAETAAHDVAQTAVMAEPEQNILARKTPKPFFTTFKSNKELPQGLSIVRRVGRHRFEIINLAAVSIAELGTVEMGRRISSSPSLMSAFDVHQDTWDDARAKVEQALKSATGEIFRFLNLPVELRFRCYELLLVSSRKLSTTHFLFGTISFSAALSVRLINRQICEESSRFFWKNNFSVPSICKVLNIMLPTFVENVQEITFQWSGRRNLDRHTFEMFASCSNLKTLKILISDNLGMRFSTQTRQYLHLQENTIRKFSGLTGFDVLASIRGLKRVHVSPAPEFSSRGQRHSECPTEADIKDLGVWLQHHLTQPKFDNEEIATKSKRRMAKSRGKKIPKDDADFRP